jgi:plasmid stabilization system protein ParE
VRLAYSVEAIGDLERLRAFIAVNNPDAARKAASQLLQGIDQLKSFPYLGVPVAQAPDPELIRDRIIGSYVVRYIITNDLLTILRIWHQREDR